MMRSGFIALLLSLPLALTAKGQSPDGISGGYPGPPPCYHYIFPGGRIPPSCIGITQVADGIVESGNIPVAGAAVYLYAAGTSGYPGSPSGGTSVSLLNSSVLTHNPGYSGQDLYGNYFVTTDVNGAFSIAGDYVCPSNASPSTQVYAYAVGGTIGSNGSNPAIGMLAVLGTCPTTGSFSSSLFLTMDEVTTVAAAYAMAGFATDALDVSSDSGVSTNVNAALADTGITKAFANAGNLALISNGTALTLTPSTTGTVPQAKINTLANILAACNEDSSVCSTLFNTATSNGISTGATPTDTATAAINIAHYPGSNVGTLFGLISSTPYTPVLSAPPNDFTVGINFTIDDRGADAIAIDGLGNVWIADTQNYILLLGATLSRRYPAPECRCRDLPSWGAASVSHLVSPSIAMAMSGLPMKGLVA